MKLISPDNVKQDDYNNINDSKYDIYANNIHYTVSPYNNNNHLYYIFNIFNLHNPYKINAYSIAYDSLYIIIEFNRLIDDICRLEIFPDRVVDADNEYCPGFGTYRYRTFDINDHYIESKNLQYDYSKNYIYNDIANCYQPQIINLYPINKIHRLDILILDPVKPVIHGKPYNKISYVKIYQKISYESYLLHSLVDDNLYQFNDDRSFTNIISYNDYINKTTSEKKEFFEKINCDKELSQLDKDIFYKFKIIKLDKDNIS